MGANTSRKHGELKPQSFSHCGSLDHPDMVPLLSSYYCHFLLGMI